MSCLYPQISPAKRRRKAACCFLYNQKAACCWGTTSLLSARSAFGSHLEQTITCSIILLRGTPSILCATSSPARNKTFIALGQVADSCDTIFYYSDHPAVGTPSGRIYCKPTQYLFNT
jgi:hypothetical protein